ncbi:hypothetical protein TNIN_396911 [Trichonephila inaurata madagascariensis]|uniref:Uncharacterized protein n=1 Tax=Trichonephila inaurata madagascariensis TaxID=2747483 RepID=A0A8X6XKP4_9ARAC|nr:hypothetical protein TNIN_396911 [Trichonephila inaurata madagascariensis]
MKTTGKLLCYNIGTSFERITVDILEPLPVTEAGDRYTYSSLWIISQRGQKLYQAIIYIRSRSINKCRRYEKKIVFHVTEFLSFCNEFQFNFIQGTLQSCTHPKNPDDSTTPTV